MHVARYVCITNVPQSVCLPVLCTEMQRKGGVSGLVNSTHQSVNSSCVSVGTNTDISGDLPVEGGLTELNIEGALTDELKLLQVTIPVVYHNSVEYVYICVVFPSHMLLMCI